jgi:cellulose synthase/poly-beta-1,6-N-acetylglucosamine synthase-like glycosyltransferase
MLSELLTATVWLGLLVQAYHYVGYPLLLGLAARLAPRPVRKGAVTPKASLIISCFNEAAVIRDKLDNSLALDYPSLEIVINSEGSTDATAEIAKSYEAKGIVAMHAPGRRGKSAAMNDAVRRASGDILVFSDANIFYRQDAISQLVANFADPEVGLVTGCKEVRAGSTDASNPAGVESIYWRYENAIKALESRIGSTVGVHGEMLAIRRELFEPISPGTVNDDAHLAMTVLARGKRVVFEPNARGWEAPSRSLTDDATRRQRMTAGRFQLLGRADLLRRLPILTLLMFLSHKALRLVLPLFALVALAANAVVVMLPDAPLSMWATLLAQLGALVLAALGTYGGRTLKSFPPAKLSAYIVSGYLAGLAGMVRAFRGEQSVLWEKAGR